MTMRLAVGVTHCKETRPVAAVKGKTDQMYIARKRYRHLPVLGYWRMPYWELLIILKIVP